MSAKLVYLDAEEEVTDLIDRLRDTDERDLALVLPARARALASRLNVKLLRQYAESLGKRCFVITPDRTVQALAIEAGMPTFASISTFEQGLAVESVDPTESSVEMVLDTPAARRAEEAARPRPRPVPGFGGQSRGRPWAWYGAGLAALLLIAAGSAFWFPTATVTIIARAEPKSVTLTVLGVPAPVSPDQATDHVETRVLQHDESASATNDATGIKQVAAVAASGMVTFTNGSGLDIKVPAGCAIATADDQKKYTTDQDANLPHASATGPSSATVNATATSAGAADNTDADTVTRVDCGGSGGAPYGLSVTNPNAFTNGADASSSKVVSQKDWDTAKAALLAQLKTKLDADMKNDLAKDRSGNTTEKLVDQTLVETPQVQADHQVNDPTDKFTLNVSVHRTETALSDQAVRDLLKAGLRATLNPATTTLLDDQDNPVTVTYSIVDARPDGSISMSGSASGFVVPHFDSGQVIARITGKSPSTARSILEASGNLEGVDISQSPPMPWLPYFSSRITLKLRQNAPTHG
ncbi:MAG: baseplate J/gp47 family protein [Candidatus Dormibacteria bacterium]